VQRIAAVHPYPMPEGFRPDSTEQERDASGNLSRDREWGWGRLWNGATAVTRLAEARHFYDGENRLRVLQRYEDTFDGASFSSAGVWEEYRYDPLGRRVMVRTRRESELCTASAVTCISSITRFVWAGDQLLWELKAPGTERDNLEATTGTGERYGRVSYTHGGGIDRPLALHKEGWQSILPHENWRGQFASGTCVPDATVPCGTPQWPGWQTNAYHYGTTPPQNEAWHGSLVDDMRDATGQMYRRNRYYDPQTGQFTQPDPIGIAGGLNVYGFAAGDPVTYADPYGLEAEEIGEQCRNRLSCVITAARGASRAFRTWRATRRARGAVDDLVDVARRSGRTAARADVPARPNGMTPNDFGTRLMRWGTGNSEARDRIGSVTREELQEAGVTHQMAREWRDFYVNEVLRNPNNPSARGRAELMHRAAELLQ
jgi:RHS repeat-associated protein